MNQLERRCPACGGVLECKLSNFSIGADGGGGLLTLLADTYEVDLYSCPSCGKVELYSADFKSPEEQEREADVVCPVCGTGHSPLIGCPRCALNAAAGGPSTWQKDRPKKKDKKPPWER